MRIINLLPNPIYFVYLGLIAFCAFILLLPTMMIEPVTGYWSYWSPDGSKLAIIAEIDGRDYEIFVADSNGANLRQLTTQSVEFYGYPTWSENSQTIYYYAPLHTNNSVRRVIDLQSHTYSVSLLRSNAVKPDENPIASDGDIETNVSTTNRSNQYYAVSTCDKYGDDVSYSLLNNCWHDLDVYSVDTDEIVWSIGVYKYRMARFGILRTPKASDLLILSLTSFFLGLCIALLRKFSPVEKPKRKSH